MSGGLRTRLALFVVVVTLTVSAVGAAGVVTDHGHTEKPSVEQPHFQPDAVEVDDLERDGKIEYEHVGESKTVLIDVAYANDVSRADLQPFVSALTAGGHDVVYHERHDSDRTVEDRRDRLRDRLQDVDAYVVVEPGARYSAEEADVVAGFADAGGRVMFAAGPETGGTADILSGLLGLSAPTADGEIESVSSSVGIAYDTGYLYDMETYEHNYRTIAATPTGDAALTAGVDRVVFDGPTRVVGDGPTLLSTNPTAEHSETREAGEYGVAVRSDNAVGVGDAGFMTGERYNRADNEVFIGNLIDFLVSGDKAPGEPSGPSDGGAAHDELPEGIGEDADGGSDGS
ncbi:hypothetical protein [Halosolutus gelatinilyticus]|uniref:hypothetical protein n=1 Tax=Halosolutus gelatinilyticus TaxID=2931975 RepID=UPI001FF4307B|nr:hypothetical protein [Halosolutus gelatinilyticus]